MEQKMREQLAAIERFKAEFRLELLSFAEVRAELNAMLAVFYQMAGQACMELGVNLEAVAA